MLPTRRRRSNPRVVKRKMSNFGVKRSDHRHRAQPTRDPAEAVTLTPHFRTAPTSPPTKRPRT
jgi:hypothetical protein